MSNIFAIRFTIFIFFFFFNIFAFHEASARKVLFAPLGYDSYVSKEFDEVQRGLVRLGWEFVPIDGEDDTETLKQFEGASAVLFFEAYDFIEKNIEALLANELVKKARKFFFCDDVQFYTKNFREKRLTSFLFADVIFATYPAQLLNFFPEISHDKVKWTPHSASSYFAPSFEPTTTTILLSGSRSWPYPFRQFCASMLSDEICTVVDHPGYPGYPGNKRILNKADQHLMQEHGQEKYGALLRQYPAMLVDGSILNYLVAKVFEGMASGCLVICDRTSLVPQLNLLGFKEGEHFLATDIFHVKDDSRDFLVKFNEDRMAWKKMVFAAHKKVASKHTTEERAKQVDMFVQNELSLEGTSDTLKKDFIRLISRNYYSYTDKEDERRSRIIQRIKDTPVTEGSCGACSYEASNEIDYDDRRREH